MSPAIPAEDQSRAAEEAADTVLERRDELRRAARALKSDEGGSVGTDACKEKIEEWIKEDNAVVGFKAAVRELQFELLRKPEDMPVDHVKDFSKGIMDKLRPALMKLTREQQAAVRRGWATCWDFKRGTVAQGATRTLLLRGLVHMAGICDLGDSAVESLKKKTKIEEENSLGTVSPYHVFDSVDGDQSAVSASAESAISEGLSAPN